MHGESIYGTSAGPFSSLEWGKCTLKTTDGKTTLYLHVFDWPENGKLTVPGLKNSIEKAMLLDGGVQLDTKAVDSDVVISLPGKATDPHVSVICLLYTSPSPRD